MNKAIDSTHKWLVLFGLYETALTIGPPPACFEAYLHSCDIEEYVGVYKIYRPALYRLAFGR